MFNRHRGSSTPVRRRIKHRARNLLLLFFGQPEAVLRRPALLTGGPAGVEGTCSVNAVQLYDRPNRSLPHAEVLEGILVSAIQQFDEVFLLLDALDECAEENEERRNLLEYLKRLAQSTNVKIFAMSRFSLDIKASMEMLGAEPFWVDVHAVNADIHDYVKNELSRD